ncbi:hypothetical protein BC628DRAFT_849869 [Trametes gibbosa]|nr:hypothetical protein BC628DRAFT_849869 [Trametes gibbosa]
MSRVREARGAGARFRQRRGHGEDCTNPKQARLTGACFKFNIGPSRFAIQSCARPLLRGALPLTAPPRFADDHHLPLPSPRPPRRIPPRSRNTKISSSGRATAHPLHLRRTRSNTNHTLAVQDCRWDVNPHWASPILSSGTTRSRVPFIYEHRACPRARPSRNQADTLFSTGYGFVRGTPAAHASTHSRPRHGNTLRTKNFAITAPARQGPGGSHSDPCPHAGGRLGRPRVPVRAAEPVAQAPHYAGFIGGAGATL